MRSGSWLLALASGAVIGAATLILSLPALLLLVPAVWWTARDRVRPLGLGGLLVGLGGGIAGLVAYATASCAASNVSGPGYRSTCEAPDLTPYLLVAAVLIIVGAGVSFLALMRTRAVAD